MITLLFYYINNVIIIINVINNNAQATLTDIQSQNLDYWMVFNACSFYLGNSIYKSNLPGLSCLRLPNDIIFSQNSEFSWKIQKRCRNNVLYINVSVQCIIRRSHDYIWDDPQHTPSNQELA